VSYLDRVMNAEELEAEREVIARMAELPRDWHPVALSGRAELTEAADRLLAIDLAEVQWDTELGVYEYRLSTAGQRVAELLAPAPDKSFRAHPASNYDGGLIEGNVLLDSPPSDEVPGGGGVYPVDHPRERPK
jgi:hypothetical protein